jgi:4-amino-4-deoxy-L-arabinose transferase-like glycosyltransferase
MDTDFVSGSRSDRRANRLSFVLGSIGAAIEASPQRAFAIFAALHTLLWTAVPSILCSNLPWDVIEGIGYGQEWQMGYWKHPPLPWWFDAAVLDVFGPHPWAFFLLGQVAILLALWGIWRLGCEMMRPLQALIAVVLQDGCTSFNILGMEFNHNTVQLPLWAWTAFFLYRGFLGRGILNWIAVGALLALTVYAKYSAVTLIVPLVLFSLLDPEARRSWFTAGPYLAMLAFALGLAPHAVWALHNGFGPVGFWDDWARPVSGVFPLLWDTLDFAVNALLLILPPFVLYLAWGGVLLPAVREQFGEFKYRFIATLTFAPITMLILAHLFLARHMESYWAQPYWTFIGLWLAINSRLATGPQSTERLAVAWVVMTVVLVGVQIAAQAFHVRENIRWAEHFPGRLMAAEMTDIWHQRTGTPLAYVIGDVWLGGNVVLYSPDRPSLFEDGNPAHSPWIDQCELNRRGGIVIWDWRLGLDHAPYGHGMVQPPMELRIATPVGAHVWTIPWAIVPPDESRASCGP